MGSNGSGKTSLLNIICGSIPVEGGQVLIDGKDITQHEANTGAIARIGRVYPESRRGHLPAT